MTAQPPSYRDLPPLEQGGRIAREGFDYQDHVTANKCLDMILPDGSNGLAEVWCEAEDDIVLVWSQHDGAERFEFVQVKGTDLKQAWSVAELCASGKGPSILKRSLDHDRGAEDCSFRMVTKWGPNATLEPLSTPLDLEQAISRTPAEGNRSIG
jgi:hypothetical protein